MLLCSADLEKRAKGGEERHHEDSASGTATPEYSASEAGSESAPRERHECVICGITTTSAAHLEVSTWQTLLSGLIRISAGRRVCGLGTIRSYLGFWVALCSHTYHGHPFLIWSCTDSYSQTPALMQYDLDICACLRSILSFYLQAHLRGRKHKRRADVVGVRVQRPSSHYCKICDITTTSAQHMAMHVAGKVGHYPSAMTQQKIFVNVKLDHHCTPGCLKSSGVC